MTGLIMAAQMIAALTILVTIHEWGHYIAARMFGVKVEKFFVFFDAWGKKLFSWKKGDTEYGVGWLPLGGYVKIAGMIDESMDKSYQNREPQSWEFRSKPAWQKLIIMLAGIFMNVVLGIFIFTLMNMTDKDIVTLEGIGSDYQISDYGKEVGLQPGDEILGANGENMLRLKDLNYKLAFGGNLDVNRNGNVIQLPVPKTHFKTEEPLVYLNSSIEVGKLSDEPSYAKEAGLKKGDVITSVNGKEYSNVEEFVNSLNERSGGQTTIGVLRDNQSVELTSEVSEEGKIGFVMKPTLSPDYPRAKLGLIESLKLGISDAFNIVWINAKAFAKIGKGEVKAKETVGGPIKIATMFGANWDWTRFWTLTAALSMVLAFMNLLPIPALDGGHAVFAIYEMIAGKPVNDKILEVAQIVGFFLLMALMVFIFGNDIVNLVQGN